MPVLTKLYWEDDSGAQIGIPGKTESKWPPFLTSSRRASTDLMHWRRLWLKSLLQQKFCIKTNLCYWIMSQSPGPSPGMPKGWFFVGTAQNTDGGLASPHLDHFLTSRLYCPREKGVDSLSGFTFTNLQGFEVVLSRNENRKNILYPETDRKAILCPAPSESSIISYCLCVSSNKRIQYSVVFK